MEGGPSSSAVTSARLAPGLVTTRLVCSSGGGAGGRASGSGVRARLQAAWLLRQLRGLAGLPHPKHPAQRCTCITSCSRVLRVSCWWLYQASTSSWLPSDSTASHSPDSTALSPSTTLLQAGRTAGQIVSPWNQTGQGAQSSASHSRSSQSSSLGQVWVPRLMPATCQGRQGTEHCGRSQRQREAAAATP